MQDDDGFVNDEFKTVFFDDIKEATEKLHSEEHDSSKNWRASAKHFQMSGEIEAPKLDFSRFFTNEWKTAKMAAKQIKFCPGEACRQWLPLFHFGENENMVDRLDVYCFTCNQRSRKKKKKTDKFEAFVSCFDEAEEEQENNNIIREVDQRIMQAARDAQKRYKRKFFVDKADVSRKLFLFKKFVCCVTGSVLTPKCFLDHHTLTFQLSTGKDKMEIVCSQCRICTPPKKSLDELANSRPVRLEDAFEKFERQ